MVRSSSYSTMATWIAWIFLRNLLIGNMVLVRNVKQPSVESHLKGVLFSNFAVKVHDTQHTEILK